MNAFARFLRTLRYAFWDTLEETTKMDESTSPRGAPAASLVAADPISAQALADDNRAQQTLAQRIEGAGKKAVDSAEQLVERVATGVESRALAVLADVHDKLFGNVNVGLTNNIESFAALNPQAQNLVEYVAALSPTDLQTLLAVSGYPADLRQAMYRVSALPATDRAAVLAFVSARQGA